MLIDKLRQLFINNPTTKYTASFLSTELDYSYTATLRTLNRLNDLGFINKEIKTYDGYYDDGESSSGGFVTVWSLNNEN